MGVREGKVSIVILSHNGKRFLPGCIQAVCEQTYPHVELMLIDNNSHDGTRGMLRQQYPWLKVIENDRNLGFAKGHNQGISLTDGEYYMPLNMDVFLTPNYVGEMVKAVESEEQIGWVSGKLYYMTAEGKLTRKIYTTGHIITRRAKAINRGSKELDEGQYNQSDYVFGANGAAPLYRREMLEDIRLGKDYYESMFFIYGEDIDLDWRAQLAGWRCVYNPRAIAYHIGEGSGARKERRGLFQYVRNKYIMILKNAFFEDLIFFFFPKVFVREFFHYFLSSKRLFLWMVFTMIGFLPQIMWKRIQTMRERVVTKEYIRQWFVEEV